MQTNEDREPEPGEYRCAMCTGIFALIRNEEWNDEMALAEKARDFPDAALEECAVICDECYQRVRPDTHPKEYGEYAALEAIRKAQREFEEKHPGLFKELADRILASYLTFHPEAISLWPQAEDSPHD